MGTDLRPDIRPCSCNAESLLRCVFGELNALTWPEMRSWTELLTRTKQLHEKAAVVLKLKTSEGVDMYSTKSLNGVPTIQRNGRNVLGVWDQDWEFACELCELLNELDDEPPLFLNEQDRKWLKAMDSAFIRRMQHA